MTMSDHREDEQEVSIFITVPARPPAPVPVPAPRKTYTSSQGGGDYDDGISTLISNLDHEIPDIRIRALKSLDRKLDVGLVYGQSLSKRQDLLEGLTSWLRSHRWTEDELRLILHFLVRMSKREEFRKNFMKTPLDAILTKARKVAKSDIRILIDRILDTVQSFDIYCEGPAEDWNDNLSGAPAIVLGPATSTPQLFKSFSDLLAPAAPKAKIQKRQQQEQMHKSFPDSGAMGDGPNGFFGISRSRSPSQKEKSKSSSTEVEQTLAPAPVQTILDSSNPDREIYYFENTSSRPRTHREYFDGTRTITLGIPNFSLESSDRRVLASTIESLLSQNEKLILITSSFYRDILLNDFPPEIFVQESSLCMSLLQVIEESQSMEQDSKIQYTIFQTLFKLANLLHLKLNYYLCSEFYQCQTQNFQGNFEQEQNHQPSTRNDSGGYNYEYQRFSPSPATAPTPKITPKRLSASTENFISNLLQLCKGISRALTFKSTNIHLWVLLESYSNLTKKIIQAFLTDSTQFYINLEEILLDISQAHTRIIRHSVSESSSINSGIVAIVISSFIGCFGSQKSPNFNLSKDVRRMIWNLASGSGADQSIHKMPEFITKYFVETVGPFEPGLDRASCGNLEPADYNAYEYWKYDAVTANRRDRSFQSENEERETQRSPEEILHSIQNAVEHTQVLQGCKDLWNSLLPLVLNKIDPKNSFDLLLIPEKCQPEWRESFCRFLSVDPSSAEDEEIVVVILDLFTFLLKNLEDSTFLKSWIVPITTEKGSALLRMLIQCYEPGGSGSSSTTLAPLIRSIFDYYLALTQIDQDYTPLDDLFSTLLKLLMITAQDSFKSPALLHPILQLISYLTSGANVGARQKLASDPNLCLTILRAVTSSIRYLGERSTDGTFRNHGSLYYGSLIVAHVTEILRTSKSESIEWIELCSQIIPSLWVIENSLIRSVSLHICCNVTSTSNGKGVFVLLTELESPTLLWRFAYRRFIDPEETSIVRQKAGTVLLNLISNWNEFRNVTQTEIAIPKVDIIQDIVSSVLCRIYWFPSLSMEPTDEINGAAVNATAGGTSTSSSFVTPNVLSVTGQLIVKIMDSNFVESETGVGMRELVILFARTIGNHQISESMDQPWWCSCCRALINALQALVTTLEVQKSLSLILISDRINLANMLRLLQLVGPKDFPKSKEIKQTLNLLRKKVLSLLTLLCSNAGNNYEDLDKLLWSQRNILFTKIIQWLNIGAFIENRRLVLSFLSVYLYESNNAKKLTSPNKLCQPWIAHPHGSAQLSYGGSICQELLNLLDNYIEDEDLISVLFNLNNLVQISSTARELSVQKGIVGKLLKRLADIGFKAISENWSVSTNLPINRKISKFIDQTKWTFLLLTNLFSSTSADENDNSAKSHALNKNFADILHAIFKTIISTTAPVHAQEKNLFHLLLELLITFTHEFPQGSQSLTSTTGTPGTLMTRVAGIKRTLNPNSLFNELLNICQLELDSIDVNLSKSPNIRTLELTSSLIQNVSFNTECRNVFLKSKIPQFLTKYHLTYGRKWGYKLPTIKTKYLNLLLQLTVHPDVQLYYGKLPESIEILVSLVEFETKPVSSLALQILRNIGFHVGNRPRLLHENRYLHTLINKLHENQSNAVPDLQEISAASTALWALISNNEKAKVAAKRLNASPILRNVIEKLKKLIHYTGTNGITAVVGASTTPSCSSRPDSKVIEKDEIQSVINLLEINLKVLNSE